ncbi:LysM peptidoglycan-binding domain-containing protein [Isoptericola sp. NPDC056134]|uniref:LysM peptidoglycan-binding domain-containing protein n=1 Tax=Isoptericola sp. NPDC056134 TaxID=3345723 RepID=UPI0035E7C652
MSGSTQRDRFARPGGLGRLAVLTVAAAGVGAALLLRAAAVTPRTTTAATGLTVDRWVELAVLAAGLLAAAWLALSGALALTCVAASLLGRRWRAGEAAVERLAPATVRRLVRTAVGAGVGAGLTLAPTVALAADLPPTPPADHGASVVLDLGWQPTATEPEAPADGGVERPAEEDTLVEEVVAAPIAHRAADDATDRADEAADDEADGGPTRVVHRGDTLWDIAAQALGGSPTDAEILREVTRWHTENRHVIGADPDHLLPGQILRAPA